MTLRELLKLLRAKVVFLAALSICAALAAAIYSWGFMPDEYTSSVSMYVLSKGANASSNESVSSSDMDASQELAKDIAVLAASSPVTSAAAAELSMKDLSGFDVEVDSASTNRVIRLSVTGQNPENVAAVANALSKQVSAVATEAMNLEAVNVVEEAVPSLEPSGPNRLRNVAVAFLVGLVLAIIFVSVRQSLSSTVDDAEELEAEFGLATIGRLPEMKDSRKQRRDDTAGKGIAADSFFRDACRSLAANIRFLAVDDEIKTIAVISSGQNEGKTTTAINLASVLAESGKRVLLLETDMRRKSLSDAIGARARYGICSVLLGDASVDQAIVSTTQPNLFLLDCEGDIPNPPDVLSTKGFALLLDSLKNSFDYVICDCPPLLGFIDSAIVGGKCDGVLFAVKQNGPKTQEIGACVNQLKRSNARILGAVMTFCKKETSSHYYYYAYYDNNGKRLAKSKSGDKRIDSVKGISASRYQKLVEESAADDSGNLGSVQYGKPTNGRHAK